MSEKWEGTRELVGRNSKSKKTVNAIGQDLTTKLTL